MSRNPSRLDITAKLSTGRLVTALILGSVFLSIAYGQTREYQVKAAFIYNFSKFVDWPAQSFNTPSEPIAICILGPDPFGRFLTDAITGKTVDGHPLIVNSVRDLDRAHACHILFITAMDRKRLRFLLDGLRGCHVLTVGDTPGFASEGGIINFVPIDGAVHLEINVDSARNNHLNISAKLLSLARIVQ